MDAWSCTCTSCHSNAWFYLYFTRGKKFTRLKLPFRIHPSYRFPDFPSKQFRLGIKNSEIFWKLAFYFSRRGT